VSSETLNPTIPYTLLYIEHCKKKEDSNKQEKAKPVKGMKQFLMLTENEHVPALDVDDSRLLPRLDDLESGVVLLQAGTVTQSVNLL